MRTRRSAARLGESQPCRPWRAAYFDECAAHLRHKTDVTVTSLPGVMAGLARFPSNPGFEGCHDISVEELLGFLPTITYVTQR